MPYVMRLKEKDHKKCVEENRCPTFAPARAETECKNGVAAEYECSNVDLQSFVPYYDLGCGGDLNDIWGWADPESGR